MNNFSFCVNKFLRIFLVSFSSIFLFPFSAMAFDIGPKLSSLGYGLEANLYDFGPISLRSNINYFNKKTFFKDGVVDYDISAKLRTFGIYGDITSPVGGIFFTGGLVFNKNVIKGTETPNANVVLYGRTYTPADIGSISTEVKFRQISPYLGMGYRIIKKPVTLNLEFGILFQGKSKVDVSATGNLASNQQLLDDLRNDLQDGLDKCKLIQYYPVVGVSVLF